MTFREQLFSFVIIFRTLYVWIHTCPQTQITNQNGGTGVVRSEGGAALRANLPTWTRGERTVSTCGSKENRGASIEGTLGRRERVRYPCDSDKCEFKFSTSLSLLGPRSTRGSLLFLFPLLVDTRTQRLTLAARTFARPSKSG